MSQFLSSNKTQLENTRTHLHGHCFRELFLFPYKGLHKVAQHKVYLLDTRSTLQEVVEKVQDGFCEDAFANKPYKGDEGKNQQQAKSRNRIPDNGLDVNQPVKRNKGKVDNVGGTYHWKQDKQASKEIVEDPPECKSPFYHCVSDSFNRSLPISFR